VTKKLSEPSTGDNTTDVALAYLVELLTKQLISLIVLMHAISYLIAHNALINSSVRQVYLCCRLSSANYCTSRLQDVTTVELVLLACQLKIIRLVMQQ